MTEWLKWTAPAAVVMSIASPAYAAQYMSVNEAQKHAFPNATGFAEVQAGRVWKAQSGGSVVGFFYSDHVIGKHLFIDYTVALEPDGRFVGKSSHSEVQVNSDIRMARADDGTTLEVSVRDHQFEPAEFQGRRRHPGPPPAPRIVALKSSGSHQSGA